MSGQHPKAFKMLQLMTRSGSPVVGSIDAGTGRIMFAAGRAPRPRLMVPNGKLVRVREPAVSFFNLINPNPRRFPC
jgi:hypothetical protein